MKIFLVPLSLLALASMANGQDGLAKLDAATFNSYLPEGFTPICLPERGLGASEPRGFDGKNQDRKKREEPPTPPPFCYKEVEDTFDKVLCKEFENNCTLTTKIFISRGKRSVCIRFPARPDKWYKMTGTFGWCGADECCEWHPKGKCNQSRPLATWFPLPAEFENCQEVPEPYDYASGGVEIMRGKPNSSKTICILDKDKLWQQEEIEFTNCGDEKNNKGESCCIFKFQDRN